MLRPPRNFPPWAMFGVICDARRKSRHGGEPVITAIKDGSVWEWSGARFRVRVLSGGLRYNIELTCVEADDRPLYPLGYQCKESSERLRKYGKIVARGVDL